MSAKTETKAKKSDQEGFTAEEKAAMKARTQELKEEARASKSREEGEKAVLAAIEQMAVQHRGDLPWQLQCAGRCTAGIRTSR